MKRSAPLKRTKPLRASQTARASSPAIRPRQCRVKLGGCGESFYPKRDKQIACSEECAENMLPYLNAKKAEERAKAERREDNAKRENLKRLKDLRAEAQEQFNRFIRLRDRLAGHGCICCGAPLDWHSTKPGGAVDAGHFIGRGAAIELAFDERNVNAQRKGCNRPGGTTRDSFRAGMVARWGLAVVEELEGPHELPQLRHDDLRQIRDTYRRKANELEKLIR
jgi:hypothetical protein